MHRPRRSLLHGALPLTLGLLPGVVRASPERPELPAFSSAGEDGAAMLWMNPATLALDPDPSAWLGFRQPMDGSPGSLSGALQRGPLAVGALYRNGADDDGWLSISNGLGVKLSRRVAVGVGIGWQIPEGPENNFLTWDATLTWRPTQWLGFSLLAVNLNNPGETLGVQQAFGGGLALRPLQGRVLLGLDYRQRDLDAESPGNLVGTLRVEPTQGLVLRAQADPRGQVGAGVELFWGRVGVGALGGVELQGGLEAGDAMGYLITGDGDQGLFTYGRRVAVFELDAAFPYQRPTSILAPYEETWLHLLRRVEEAIDDPAVDGLVFAIDRAPSSWARGQELAASLRRAREAGKTTTVWLGRDAGNLAYLIAVQAERVYLHPAANVDLIGLSAELTYFRGTLDLLGVQPQYVKRSEYKSAPEQWTHHGPSEASREQLDAMLDQLHGQLTQGVSAGRSRSVEQVQRWIDHGPFTAAQAVESGLVDGLAWKDELEDRLEQQARRNLDLEPWYRLDDNVTGWPTAREVAIIYVDGVIVSGSSSPGGLLGNRTAGSETIVRQLDQARRDDAVQAVVMRVDSPGGSAYASDEIWRATQRLREAGKPLIVSMGGVAASGGYYVAAGADRILAEPATLTGSIGVFSGRFSIQKLQETLGVQTETLERGRFASLYGSSRPLDEAELELLDGLVAATYDQFKERVAKGRSMSAERVEEVARGRVWTGQAALEVGLVDELGGIVEAVEAARAAAGIPRSALVELVVYGDRQVGPLPRRSVEVLSRAGLLPDPPAPLSLGPIEPLARSIHAWSALAEDPVWALMPWSVELR